MTRKTIRVGEHEYPVEIHVEDRPNVRGSIGRRAVYIRLPRALGAEERSRHVQRLLDWARQRLSEQPPEPMIQVAGLAAVTSTASSRPGSLSTRSRATLSSSFG